MISLSSKFVGPKNLLNYRNFSSVIDAFAGAFQRRRDLALTRIRPNDSSIYQSIGLPAFDSVPSSDQINRLDPFQLANVAMTALSAGKNKSVIANDPVVDRTGHFYQYTSALKQLSQKALQTETALGNNRMRLLIGMMPYRGTEIPPEVWAAERTRVLAQGNRILPVTDLLQDPKLAGAVNAFKTAQWHANAPIDGILSLMRFNFIIGSQHFTHQQGEFVVTGFRATTTQVHNLRGTAWHLRVVNTRTGEARYVVVGAGEHPIRMMDTGNNLLVGMLWDVMGNSYDAVLEHWDELAAAFPDIGPHLGTPEFQQALRELQPESDRRDLRLLDTFDRGSALMVRYLSEGFTDAQLPTSDTVDRAIEVLDEAADAPLLTDAEETRLFDEQAKEDPVRPVSDPDDAAVRDITADVPWDYVHDQLEKGLDREVGAALDAMIDPFSADSSTLLQQIDSPAMRDPIVTATADLVWESAAADPRVDDLIAKRGKDEVRVLFDRASEAVVARLEGSPSQGWISAAIAKSLTARRAHFAAENAQATREKLAALATRSDRTQREMEAAQQTLADVQAELAKKPSDAELAARAKQASDDVAHLVEENAANEDDRARLDDEQAEQEARETRERSEAADASKREADEKERAFDGR